METALSGGVCHRTVYLDCQSHRDRGLCRLGGPHGPGLVTAVGGGVIRDLILGLTPPMAFQDPTSALVALAVSAVFFLGRVRRLLMYKPALFNHLLFWMDALGLGVFTVPGPAGGGYPVHLRQACIRLRLPGRGDSLRWAVVPAGEHGGHAPGTDSGGAHPGAGRPLPVESAPVQGIKV